MGNIRKSKSKVQIGHALVTLESEIIHNEILDTSVYVGSEFLCCIAGDDTGKFVKEFQQLVDKYKI